MRIASLLSSATEIVYGLGLEERLVGVSHECDFPPEVLAKPRVSRTRADLSGLTSGQIDVSVRETTIRYGSVYELDHRLLRELRPDLVLTQELCEVCAVPSSLARDAAGLLGGEVDVLTLDVHDTQDLFRCIEAVGKATGVPERAARYVTQLRDRIEVVRNKVARNPRPTVLALEWLEPPFVPGHWVPEMVDLAGGTLLKGDANAPSRTASWSELEGMDPDVLLIMPCGFDLERTRAEAYRYSGPLVSTGRRAIAGGRAYVVDGSSYFSRSGPRIVDGIEILAALFHPDDAQGVELEGRVAEWRPGETVTQ